MINYSNKFGRDGRVRGLMITSRASLPSPTFVVVREVVGAVEGSDSTLSPEVPVRRRQGWSCQDPFLNLVGTRRRREGEACVLLSLLSGRSVKVTRGSREWACNRRVRGGQGRICSRNLQIYSALSRTGGSRGVGEGKHLEFYRRRP